MAGSSDSRYQLSFSLFFFKDFIYLYLERREGREKERERNDPYVRETMGCLWCAPSLAQASALMGSWTGDFLVCWMMPNPLRHTSHVSLYIYLSRPLSLSLSPPPPQGEGGWDDSNSPWPPPTKQALHRVSAPTQSHLGEQGGQRGGFLVGPVWIMCSFLNQSLLTREIRYYDWSRRGRMPTHCPQGGRNNPTQSICVLHRKEVFSYQNKGRVAEQAKQYMFATEIQLKK